MILVCPNCAARYEVDGTQFPAEGRKVRCKKCSHVWHQQPEADRAEIEAAIFNPPADSEPVADIALQDEPESEPAADAPSAWRMPATEDEETEDTGYQLEEPAKAKRIGSSVLMILGWAALVIVILVIGWSAANYRSQIVGIWPQSASLFSKLGMAVNTRGLDFADVRHTNQTEDGQPVLVITGKVVNVTGKKLDVPPLRVTLSDAKKHAIYDWSFEPSSRALAPGQAVGFRTRLSNPPSATRHVELRFAGDKE